MEDTIIYSSPGVTNMCPAVALGLVAAQNELLTESVAARIIKVSDLMTLLAQEEREGQLAKLDKLIARAKASGRIEGE